MIVRVALGFWIGAFLVFAVLPSGVQASRLRTFTTGELESVASFGFRLGQDSAVDTEAAVREGATLYGGRCADCHGADATGAIGPDLTSLWASGVSEDRIFQTIRFGRPGSVMPPSMAPDDDLRAIIAYLRSIATTPPDESAIGDAAQGLEVFRSTCARCHRLDNQGGRLGPDLTRIGSIRSRAELQRAIRDPGADVVAGYRTVTLVTRDGQQIRGVRKGEDAFSIQIVDTNERLQGYVKADLREVVRDEGSLMPEFGPDVLSDADLDDLLRFLGTLRVEDAGNP